jgi:hypothetical protein
MSTGSIGYTSGALYKRHQHINYQSGNKFKRWGGFGLIQQRNLSSMNRQAAANYNYSFSSVGYMAFDATQSESLGRSELIAEDYAKKVKEAINQLAEGGEATSLANGGAGNTSTGTILDTTT